MSDTDHPKTIDFGGYTYYYPPMRLGYMFGRLRGLPTKSCSGSSGSHVQRCM